MMERKDLITTRSWLWHQNFHWSLDTSSAPRLSSSSTETSMAESTCSLSSTQSLERTTCSKPEFTSVCMTPPETVTSQKITLRSTFQSWFQHFITLRASTRNLRKCTLHVHLRSSSFSLTLKELAEFTLRTCLHHPFWLNCMNWDKRDTLKRSWTRTGFQCLMRLHFITGSTSLTLTRIELWEKRTWASTQEDFQVSWLTDCTRSTKLSTANWTSRDS